MAEVAQLTAGFAGRRLALQSMPYNDEAIANLMDGLLGATWVTAHSHVNGACHVLWQVPAWCEDRTGACRQDW